MGLDPSELEHLLELATKASRPDEAERARGINLLSLTLVALATSVGSAVSYGYRPEREWALASAIGGGAVLIGVLVKLIYWWRRQERRMEDLQGIAELNKTFRDALVSILTLYWEHMLNHEEASRRIEDTYRAAGIPQQAVLKDLAFSSLAGPRPSDVRQPPQDVVSKGIARLKKLRTGGKCMELLDKLKTAGLSVHVVPVAQQILFVTELAGETCVANAEPGGEYEALLKLARAAGLAS